MRSNTDIGSASISMAAAAVKLAERIYPSLADQHLLLIGAGEMIDLAAAHFAAKASEVDHRRQPHARARRAARRALRRQRDHAERAARAPGQFDIIVTSTASSLPILGKGLLERAIKSRRHAPMFIVDLAVPRDVEPEAAELDDVFLYSVDDLANIVKDNLQIRVDALAQAEEMIAEQAQSFLRWLDGRSVVPTLTALQGHHESLRAAEVERARKLLAGGAAPEQVIEQLARGLTNKFLHAPAQALTRAGDAERAELLALLHHIYQLPDDALAVAHRAARASSPSAASRLDAFEARQLDASSSDQQCGAPVAAQKPRIARHETIAVHQAQPARRRGWRN